MARAYVGTSGWNYKHWRGLIYPQGLPQRRWLEHLAPHFDTVEINTSFYRIPKAESVENWVAATPPGFLFALKLWRGITHYRKLIDTADFTRSFLDVAESLPPDRRAPLLVQLPPNQSRDLPKLEKWLKEFEEIAPSRWRIAVEFRHPSWLDEEVRHLLDRHQAALCIHDMAGRGETREPNSAPFVYVRRHGTAGGRYSGSYSPEAIRADATNVRKWLREGRDVFVYYNNDIGGHAWHNAAELRSAV